tara:strand:+ start:5051 stop:5644 length:594 start_codon:yes stop_codon:yes gene_type:complete
MANVYLTPEQQMAVLRENYRLRKRLKRKKHSFAGSILGAIAGGHLGYKALRKAPPAVATTGGIAASLLGSMAGSRALGELTKSSTLSKEAARAELTAALLRRMKMPTFANWLERTAGRTADKVEKALMYELPVARNRRLLSEARSRNIARMVANSPEDAAIALGMTATPIPGTMALSVPVLKGKKRLEQALLKKLKK